MRLSKIVAASSQEIGQELGISCASVFRAEPFLKTVNTIVKSRWGSIEDFCKAHKHPVGTEPDWDMKALFAGYSQPLGKRRRVHRQVPFGGPCQR